MGKGGTTSVPGRGWQRPLSRGMGYFTLLWLGQLVSIVGSGMTGFAVGVTLFQETRSVTLYALIGLSIALPTILLSPLAGALADRFDRRLILLLAAMGSACGTLVLFYLAVRGQLVPWHVYVIMAVKAGFGAFVWPTFAAATTLIVDKEHFGRASGMTQMAASLGNIFSPILGGLLVEPIGVSGVVLIDVATFFFAAAMLLAVRFPQPEVVKQPAVAETRTAAAATAVAAGQTDRRARVGWSFVRERPGLLWLLLLFAGLNFCVGTVQVLVTPLVLSFTSPRTLGLVLAAAWGGSLVGGVVMSVWGGPRPGQRVKAILTIMLLSGLFLIAGGLQANATLISSAAFFFMLGFPLIAGCSQVIWQTKVPPGIQGRVFAIRRMIAGSAVPVAFAVAGPLADHVFEPLMAIGGPLAASVGPILGVGPGRGIGLILVTSGLGILTLVVVGLRSAVLRRVETEVPDAVGEPRKAEEPAPPEDETAGEALGRLGPIPALALLAVVVLAAAGAILLERPPAATTGAAGPAAAGPGFSVQRALRHVEATSQQPHPTGSPAQREVRDYLVAELREIGLETEVQHAHSVHAAPPLVRVVTVDNVVARLRGRDGGRAVLLAAHYDSVPTAPGASDNGAAVATLLETARALAAGPQLANDVIFFFPDAEEVGLNGARAFVAEHPWAREVAVVLNFDARGHGGPVYMFQTGADNGWWIRRFSAAAVQPRASSLLNQIYQRLPSDTDFTVFLEAGYPGFNMAFIEGLTHYHSMLDRAADVDPRSVGHQGTYALGLARQLAQLDLAGEPAERRQPDRVYFNVLGPHMIHYPPAIAVASAVLAAVLFVAVLGIGLQRRRLSVFGVAQGFLAFFGMLTAIPIAVTLAWFVLRDAASVTVIMGSTEGAWLYMIAFGVLTLAAFVALMRFFRGVVSALSLAMGALVWWLFLALAASGIWLPAESNFIFVWPLIASLAGLGFLFLTPAESLRPWRVTAVLAVTSLPGLVLGAPLVVTLYVGLQSIFELGGAALALEVLLLGLLLPHLEAVAGPRSAGLRASRTAWLAPAAALGGAVCLAMAVTGASETAPRGLDSVFYALDADTGERHWFSFDQKPDAWTRQFGFEEGVTGPFAHLFPLVRFELLRSAAPAVELPRPDLEIVDERQLSERFREIRLRLRLATAGESGIRAIWFEPAAAVAAVMIAGRTFSLRDAAGDGPGPPVIQRIPPVLPEEEMTLRIEGAGPVTVHVTDQLAGLPEIPGLAPRPEGWLPRPLFATVRSDVTLVHRSFTLPARSGPAE